MQTRKGSGPCFWHTPLMHRECSGQATLSLTRKDPEGPGSSAGCVVLRGLSGVVSPHLWLNSKAGREETLTHMNQRTQQTGGPDKILNSEPNLSDVAKTTQLISKHQNSNIGCYATKAQYPFIASPKYSTHISYCRCVYSLMHHSLIQQTSAPITCKQGSASCKQGNWKYY